MNKTNSTDAVKLSVVVAIVSDTTDSRCNVSHLEGCLEALTQQLDPPSIEIIVPYHQHVEGIEGVKHRFPDVVFTPAKNLTTYTGRGGSREHHDELRARGLAIARGEIVGLIEDHGRPDPYWCARVVEAHRQNYAAVGGAMENGIDRPLNWAVYFCDFGKYQNPAPEGESPFVSDANVSYKRSTLESIRPTWQEIFQESTVNRALTSRGEKLALSPTIIVYQQRLHLRFSSALKERFIWGRSYATSRSKLLSKSKRLIYAALTPVLPGVLLLRMAVNVLKKRRCFSDFLKALPLTVMLTLSWSCGELVAYLTAPVNSPGAPAAETISQPQID